MQVSVTEREPVQALREADILAKLTPAVRHLADLGPVTEPGMCQQICHSFDKAAAPNRAQPYRYPKFISACTSRIYNQLHIKQEVSLKQTCFLCLK